jgi:hypothetical protein
MREAELLEASLTKLRQMLPASWILERSPESHGRSSSLVAAGVNCAADLHAANGTRAQLLLKVVGRLSPRSAEASLAALAQAEEALDGRPPLVIAGWLSTRSQELLAQSGVSYMDLTGNALVLLEDPALYISSEGATRDPDPAPRGKARVSGSKAARIVRLLVDVAPPYRVGEVAEATGLTPAYVSRMLETLHHETLIERSVRGWVSDVDIPGLLRRFAESYDIFKANRTRRFHAPGGTLQLLSRLADLPDPAALTITGSFAAARLAPLAVPAMLLAYTRDPKTIAEQLGLTRAHKGANVVLLGAFDPVVWERTSEQGCVRYVSPAQAAIDCLTGGGRMPSEGATLLGWMVEHQSSWRVRSLRELAGAAHGGV